MFLHTKGCPDWLLSFWKPIRAKPTPNRLTLNAEGFGDSRLRVTSRMEFRNLFVLLDPSLPALLAPDLLLSWQWFGVGWRLAGGLHCW